MINTFRKFVRDRLRELSRRPVPYGNTDAHPVFKFTVSETATGDCDAERLEAVAAYITNLCLALLLLLDFLARVFLFMCKPLSFLLPRTYQHGELLADRDTVFQPRRQEDASDDATLNRWLTSEGPPLFPRVSSFCYNSERDMWSQLRVDCFYGAHLQNSTMLLRQDDDKLQTADEVRKKLRRIHARAKGSARFHIHFATLIDLLDDMLTASPQAMSRFLRRVSMQVASWPYIWMTEAAQRFAHTREHNARAFEGGLATLALFFHEGAGPEMFYMRGWWYRRDRAVSASLSTLMYFVIDKCGPLVDYPPVEHAVSRRSNGVEQIFWIQEEDAQFRQMVSKFAKPSHKLYKDMLFWDFTLNNCNEFVEQAWSVETMERAIWALQYGRQYFSQRTYDMLVKQRNTRSLNLTFFKVRTLLSFSVSGIIRFIGYDACIFNVTGDENAPVLIHGYLPRPTIGDLVDLGLAASIGFGRFRMENFPGCSVQHKGIQTGDRILIVRSKHNVAFKADLKQKVG